MPSSEHDQIQNWFLAQSEDIKKEKVIEDHRADIVINNKIIVEIQCTNISVGEYEKRNYDYMVCGYYPVWVFGKNFYNHARKSSRYGLYIKEIEKIEIDKYGFIFLHNKYNVFISFFKYKFSSDYYQDYCDYKGWYDINGPLSFNDFLDIIDERYRGTIL